MERKQNKKGKNRQMAKKSLSQNRTIDINLPSQFRYKQLLDSYDSDRPIKIVKGQIKFTIPMQAARVYIVPQKS